jgi:glycosyltransferase involved in cell wall biosynthesis
MHQFQDYPEAEYECDVAGTTSMRFMFDHEYPHVEEGYCSKPGSGMPCCLPETEYPVERDDCRMSSSHESLQSFSASQFSEKIRCEDAFVTRMPVPARPLSIACIGPNFRVGGVRQHALSLAKFFDPRRARVEGFWVTDPASVDSISDNCQRLPVQTCDKATMQRISEDCDVLLMWGDGFSSFPISQKPVRIFLAHGETQWTRNALQESSKVVDHVIAVSHRVQEAVCHGFPTTTILNGVDAGRLAQSFNRETIRSRLAFRPDDFIVGSVGRFTREKQFDLLIQAIERLPPNFKLLLVGSGRRQSELLEFANRHIPGRFAFVSANDYLGDYYAAMDAFGMVSAHEGFGLVLAEAMMCSRPVFATNVGCVPEVICDRVNGVVVQPNADCIAMTIRMIHANPLWSQGIAKQGRAFAGQHLHAARMAAQYEDLLASLVQHHRRSHDREAL